MIENILDSTTKIKILRLLLEFSNRNFSTDEILRNTFSGRGYAGKCIALLLKSGVIKMEKVGKEKRYTINKESVFYEPLKKMFEQEKLQYPTLSYIHRSIIAEIVERLTEETIILYGSVAAGTYTPESDVDLLVITERKDFVRSVIKKIEKRNKVNIQGILLTMEELESRIKEKSRFVKNIAREYVFITGNEKILNMIKNV